MKKITLIFALACFTTGFSQVVQKAAPSLSRAEAQIAARTASVQTNGDNVFTRGVNNGQAIQSESTRGLEAPHSASQFVLSQSVDNETLAAGTIACGGGGTTRENSWFRTYTPADFGLSGDVQIDGLEFAYTFAGAGADGTGVIRAWTSDDVFPAGTYTQIAEAQMTYDLAGADVKTFFPFDVPAVVDANTEIIVEVFAEDDPDNDIRLYDNDLGENGPGYVFSATCGLTAPTPFSAIGFPDNHIILDLAGTELAPTTNIFFDPAANYIGYMNVFETPANGGGFVFGSGWGVPDLKTVVDPTPVTGSVTLYPNFNTYDDNPTDPFWVDQATGLGNKTMEANTYVDDPTLAGQNLTWSGFVISNTIDPAYEAVAFIKVFNANFSVLKIETAPLIEGEFFEVSYTDVEPEDTFVQYGWYVKGLNASSANEAALGNVVIGTENPGCGDFSYTNEVPTGGGPPAQIFPDFPDFTSIAVDDVFFSGDAGLICSIDIEGRYTEGAPGLPGDPNGAVQLTIYKDDGGVPGAVHYEETFPGSVDADGDANFTLEPAQVIQATLNPDTRYWISVAVVMEFGLGGQWFWGSAEDTNDNAALWQNPGGGFGVCPTWGTFADCGVGGGLGPDLMMDVELVTTDPLTYDVCYGARTIECGDTLTGDTLSATEEAGLTECGTSITAPGVWYVFEDNSGLASEVLLSTCNQADYDTKLYVFTGSCGDLVCIDGNDDTTGCSGFTTELEFVSDGNSTYYILVAGFSSATGTFDLSMECTLIPPPNNDIEDAIDLLAVGCPFTDEDVAMPAATEEDGTPAGCDISGAAGVWYEFTPEINGFITGTIASPAGVSSVTFYTAPDQSSSETDLVHVDYYQNQCLPGSSATIPVIGGQTYYCFVVNTGGITDIVFDNCQLGTASNEIEGFEFYPNPTRERINLAAAQNIESVVLYNILGQRMMEVNVDATTTELNVAHLAAGAYLMEVTVDGQTGTYKLIKQ